MIQKIKKGELTTQQIVLLIILIASFAVILFFLFRLNLSEQTQKEICHNSVVLKGKSNLAGELDCKTSYVCISGGEECKDILPTETIKIDSGKDSEKVKEETLQAIADKMAECWWMFGEGKVDYVGLNIEGATIGQVNCAVCSTIKFDENIKNYAGQNTFGDLYDYLSTTKKDNSQTYLQYLRQSSTYDKTNPVYSESINFNEDYVVVTGIAKEGAIRATAFWLGSGYDLLNSWVPFVEFDKFDKSGDYGPFPAIIVKQSELDKVGCDNFITKA